MFRVHLTEADYEEYDSYEAARASQRELNATGNPGSWIEDSRDD